MTVGAVYLAFVGGGTHDVGGMELRAETGRGCLFKENLLKRKKIEESIKGGEDAVSLGSIAASTSRVPVSQAGCKKFSI